MQVRSYDGNCLHYYSWWFAFILQEVHVNLVHIQLQYAGRLAEAQKASQVGLCTAFVAVHKFLNVCPSLRHNTTYLTIIALPVQAVFTLLRACMILNI